MNNMLFLRTTFALATLAASTTAYSQETAGKFIKDQRSGCTVWFKHNFFEDSVTWSGGCKDGFATGNGTLIGYAQGEKTLEYVGEMQEGKPHGQGDLHFWGDRRLNGNFHMGEPLFLSDSVIGQLKKNIIRTTDSLNMYVADNNAADLYYHSIIPKGEIKGTVVLMPGTWETTEHLLSSMADFCELAVREKLAIMALSINQRLTLTQGTVDLMNEMFDHAKKTYKLPDQFILGGWSMGGLFSIRYTELALASPLSTSIHPKAVFSCDGPCDLENIYNNFKRKYMKNPEQQEPIYGMRELEKYCNGTPETARENYQYFSIYSRADSLGGNARYLTQTPIRIYADIDPVWWMQNRHVDMYDLNGLDQSAMIQLLNDKGNTKAEFINNFQKGYRLEGNRHPHSWSIIEPHDCLTWVLNCFQE